MAHAAHRAIVCTGWDADDLAIVRQRAVDICGNLVSLAAESRTTGFISFFIAPHGGSHDGDRNRKEFTDWLRRYLDDCDADVEFVEVQYGGCDV